MVVVCWLVVEHPSNMLVYLRDRSAHTICLFCHTEMEVANQTLHLTQSEYPDPGPTSPSAYPIVPGVCQGSHWSTNFKVTGMTRPGKRSMAGGGMEPRSADLGADPLCYVYTGCN